MKLQGIFLFLGAETGNNKEGKVFHRIGLTQGLNSKIFFVSDEDLWSRIQKANLKTGQQVTATINISESKDRTFFSIVDIEVN